MLGRVAVMRPQGQPLGRELIGKSCVADQSAPPIITNPDQLTRFARKPASLSRLAGDGFDRSAEYYLPVRAQVRFSDGLQIYYRGCVDSQRG